MENRGQSRLFKLILVAGLTGPSLVALAQANSVWSGGQCNGTVAECIQTGREMGQQGLQKQQNEQSSKYLQQQLLQRPPQQEQGKQEDNPMSKVIQQMLGGGQGGQGQGVQGNQGGLGNDPNGRNGYGGFGGYGTYGGDRESVGGGGWRYGGGGGPSGPAGTISVDDLKEDSSTGRAKIVKPLKKWFPICTEKVGLKTCKFVNIGIWGDDPHKRTESCHNSGEAMDVGLPLSCSDGVSITESKRGQPPDPRALALAKCMAKETNDELQVIFHDYEDRPNMFPGGVRNKHHGHMHIQLKNCRMVRGR